MLQVDIEERAGTELIFTLKGEISGVDADELISRWEESPRVGRVCIVDVSEVWEMDQAGKVAICRLARDGARFRASGPMIDCVIDLVCKTNTEALQSGRREFRSIVFNG
jgi:ABC-type transporter Mla MlaB component